MSTTNTDPDERLVRQLKATSFEALLFLTKAFRHEVDLSKPEERSLLGPAASVVGNWTRHDGTVSSQRMIDAAMARHLADDIEGRFAGALELVMPEDKVSRALKPAIGPSE